MFDAKIFSRWGRAEFRGTGNVDLLARSGNVDNPDRNWSPWKQVDLSKGAEMGCSRRPLRAMESRAARRRQPSAVDTVTMNYLPKNVAPEIEDVSVQSGIALPAARRNLRPEYEQRYRRFFGPHFRIARVPARMTATRSA